MNKSLKIKKIIGISIFAILVVVLQLFSNYVTFGPVNITLSLTPIVVGSIIYGPFVGSFLGLISGLFVFFAHTTMATFWEYGIFITFLVCILKMGIAGFISGIIYKYLHRFNQKFSVVLSSISVPIVNTGLFAIATLIFYKDLLYNFASEGQSIITYLFLYFIGSNFLIEFAVNSFLSPVVLRLITVADENFDLGISK